MKQLKLTVEGFTCSGCAMDVATALKNAEGVLDAETDYASGSVSVDYEPRETDEQKVLALVKRMGLKVVHRGPES